MSHGDGEVRASEQSYVVKWLNEEVRMSRSIHSLETQFANGYLVGELLHRQGVLAEAGLGRRGLVHATGQGAERCECVCVV